MTRGILASKNEYVDNINQILIHQFSGSPMVYYSFDSAVDGTHQVVEEEFLNQLTPTGMPPHELALKKNCPVMLLRNIDPLSGLCNGTRLICRDFQENIIDVEITNGLHKGECFFNVFHYNQQRMRSFLSSSKENNFLSNSL